MEFREVQVERKNKAEKVYSFALKRSEKASNQRELN
jgi:hypothetical protein